MAIEAFKTRVGGCAANVAIDLRKQSQTVELVGCIGQDAAGAYLVKELLASQVNCDQLAYTAELSYQRNRDSVGGRRRPPVLALFRRQPGV